MRHRSMRTGKKSGFAFLVFTVIRLSCIQTVRAWVILLAISVPGCRRMKQPRRGDSNGGFIVGDADALGAGNVDDQDNSRDITPASMYRRGISSSGSQAGSERITTCARIVPPKSVIPKNVVSPVSRVIETTIDVAGS